MAEPQTQISFIYSLTHCFSNFICKSISQAVAFFGEIIYNTKTCYRFSEMMREKTEDEKWIRKLYRY